MKFNKLHGELLLKDKDKSKIDTMEQDKANKKKEGEKNQEKQFQSWPAGWNNKRRPDSPESSFN
mgnify:CR=1 FL=1